MTTPALLQLHECAHMGAFCFMKYILVKAVGGTLAALLLYMTVVDEKEQKEYEAIGRISMYAIHISVPAAAFTYEIDGTSSRTRSDKGELL